MTFTVLKPPAVSWSRDPQVARDNTWAHIINKHSGRPFSLTGSAHESMHSRHRLFGGPIPSRPTKTLESMGALTKHIPRRSWLYLHGPTVSVYLMNFHVLRSERLKHWGKPTGPKTSRQPTSKSGKYSTIPAPNLLWLFKIPLDISIFYFNISFLVPCISCLGCLAFPLTEKVGREVCASDSRKQKGESS